MIKLRECKNSMVGIGTLKSKSVTYGTTNNGDKTIAVDLVLASVESDKVNEHKTRLWAKNTSKLYKSYETVANEYKTLEEHGNEADRIKITGSLEMNEYFSSNASELKTFNNLRTVFVNRLDKESKDEVGAVLECVITGIIDEISKDGVLTGRKKLKLMTIGYENRVHEIQNVFVEKDMVQAFMSIYKENSTAVLFLKVNSYAEIDEEKTKPVEIGFGSSLSNMPDSTVKNYVNEVICVGGDKPNPTTQFTNEQISETLKIREMSRQEKLNSAPSTPPSGFGTRFDSGVSSTPSGNEEDLPF